jgi:hypothetical protein
VQAREDALADGEAMLHSEQLRVAARDRDADERERLQKAEASRLAARAREVEGDAKRGREEMAKREKELAASARREARDLEALRQQVEAKARALPAGAGRTMVPHDRPHARVSPPAPAPVAAPLSRCEPVASRANLASPPPGDGSEPSDVSELLAACNAYVDNIVSENQRMRSKLLTAMRACDADGP